MHRITGRNKQGRNATALSFAIDSLMLRENLLTFSSNNNTMQKRPTFHTDLDNHLPTPAMADLNIMNLLKLRAGKEWAIKKQKAVR